MEKNRLVRLVNGGGLEAREKKGPGRARGLAELGEPGVSRPAWPRGTGPGDGLGERRRKR